MLYSICISLSVGVDQPRNQSRPKRSPEKMHAKSTSLDAAFESCFKDWGVDTTKKTTFGLWRKSADKKTLNELNGNSKPPSGSLVNSIIIRQSKNICNENFEISLKRKLE